MTNTTTTEYYIVKINHPTGWQEQPEKFAFIEDVETQYNIKENTKVFHVKVVREEEEIL